MIKTIIFFLILAIIFSNLNLSFALENKQEIKNLCSFTRDLRIGSKGEDVKCLQQYLKELNLFKHNPTAYYGFLTRNAVLKWQKMNGLKQTGVFDINSRIKYYLTRTFQEKIVQDQNNILSVISNVKLSKPVVEDKDIIIDNNSNLKTIENYFKYIFLDMLGPDDFKKLFDNSFNGKPLFENTEPLLPEFLIENTLKSEQFDKDFLINKATVLKEFFEKKVNALKQTKVQENIKEIHKLMIASDYISLEILNKFLDFLNNKIDKQEMELYLKKYREILFDMHRDFNSILIFESGNKNILDVFYKIFSYIFFIPLKTSAQLIPTVFLPFGGKILFVTPCPCSLGFLVFVSPPRPMILFVPWMFLSSPLLFLYRNILTPGVWVLGLVFTEIMIPCLVGVPPFCTTVMPGNLIYEAGTGGTPSPF